ncbi:MAG TPA: aldose epimerase family protein [Spirochaetia bacterium]|nr:aldose epimerase family protein [Spirochaetia bacterium]
MVTLAQRVFGRTQEGDEIVQFTLEAGPVSVQLLSYGATLSSVKIPDRTGKVDEVTPGFDTLEGYLNPHPYLGATVGRFANRIARGRFTLDGKTYSLFCNNGRNHLHGGKKGFDRMVWSSAGFQREHEAGVHFSYLSPDGEEGYPGSLDVHVTYTLEDSGSLLVAWEARADKPTIVNLTNHVYWNLAGPGRGDIKSHLLTLEAERYLPSDSELIPTGEIKAVDGTAYDFRREKPIGRDIEAAGGGYDSCFVLGAPADGWRKVGRVRDPASGRGVEVFATQPGVHFYSGQMFPALTGRGGASYGKFSALALETEGFPDAINRPAFPSVVLRPGQTYSERTRYRFFHD